MAGGFRSLALPEIGGASALGPQRTTSATLSAAVGTGLSASAALSVLVRLDGGFRGPALLELGGISASRPSGTVSAPLSVYVRQGGLRGLALPELGGISGLDVPASRASAPLSVAVQQAGIAPVPLSSVVQAARTTSVALSVQVASSAVGFHGLALQEVGGISAAPPQVPKVPVYDDGVPQAWAADIGWSAVYAYQPLGVQPAFNQRGATAEVALSALIDAPKIVEVPISCAVLAAQAASASLSAYVRQDGGLRSLALPELGGISAVPPETPRVLPYDDGLPQAWAADIGWSAVYAHHQDGMPVFSRLQAVVAELPLSVGVGFVGASAADLSVLVYSDPTIGVSLSAAIEASAELPVMASVAVQSMPVASAGLGVCVMTPLTVQAPVSVPVSASYEAAAPVSAALSLAQEWSAALDAVVATPGAAAADVSVVVLDAQMTQASVPVSAAVLQQRAADADLSVAVQAPAAGYVVDVSVLVGVLNVFEAQAELSAAVIASPISGAPVSAAVQVPATVAIGLSAAVMDQGASAVALDASVAVLCPRRARAGLSVLVAVPYTPAPPGGGYQPCR